MSKKNSFCDVGRIYRAFFHSLAGLRDAIKTEAAFTQEVFLCVLLFPLPFILERTPIEIILMVGSVLLILIIELINAAIEAAIDRISSDIHPLSKKAKDMGSAAVLLAFINALMVWGLLLLY